MKSLGRGIRCCLIIGVWSLMMAAPFLSTTLHAAGATAPNIVNRWKTDNTTLRPVTYADGVVYAAGDASIEAWDTQRGRMLWKAALDTPADFRPRLVGDLVLAIGRSYISAYARKDGALKWSYRPQPAPNAAFEPIATPYVHNERIYLGVGPMMTALDRNGEIVWQRPSREKKGIWYAPEPYGEDTILFGPGDGLLYALDTENGDVRWTLDNSKKWQYLRQLHLTGTTLVAGGYKDNLFGVDVKSGKVSWHWYSGNFINSHLVYDGAAYLWSPTGWVYALDAQSGHVRWRTLSDYFPKKSKKKRPWAPVMAELVADDSQLFVLDMQNTLHILDTQNGQELRVVTFSERLSPFVTLVPGARELFLGTVDGEILHVKLD